MSTLDLFATDSQFGEAAPYVPTDFGDVVSSAIVSTSFGLPDAMPRYKRSQAQEEREKIISERFGSKVLENTLSKTREENPFYDPVGIAKSYADPDYYAKQYQKNLDTLVEQGRQTEPDRWQGIKTSSEIDEEIKSVSRAAIDTAGEIAQKAPTVSRITGTLLGGLGGAMTDPINIATLPFGAGASLGILRAMGIDALLNAGIEAYQQPEIMKWQKELGYKYGIGDAAISIATAGAGAGIISGVARGAAPATRAVGEALRIKSMPILERMAFSTKLPSQVRDAAAYMARIAHVDEEIPSGLREAIEALNPEGMPVKDYEVVAANRENLQETQDAFRNYREPELPYNTARISSNTVSEAGIPAITSPTENALVGRQALPVQTQTLAPPSGLSSIATMEPSTLTGDMEYVGTMKVSPKGDMAMVYQGINDVNALHSLATKLLTPVQDWLKGQISDIPGIKLYGARVKVEKTLKMKIKKKGRRPDQISDYLGAKVIVDDFQSIRKLMDKLNANAKVIEAEDFLFKDKGGYRGVHLQILTDEGLSYELQIVPKEIHEIYDQARKFYENWKDFRGDLTPEQKKLMQEDTARAKKVFDDAWIKWLERNHVEQLTAAPKAESSEKAEPADKEESTQEKPIKYKPVKDDKAYTPTGKQIDVEYAVVDASKLIASQKDNLTNNPDYPQELQPRDRTRAASQQQIQEIASQLRPELLAENPLVSEGAPVIGLDGVVESGNGRILAIRKAYNEKMLSSKRYREFIAERFDISGIKNPVLVRIRKTPMDMKERAVFAREANERTTASMSATERAQVDVKALGDAISLFRGGDLTSAQNRPFLRAFMEKVVAAADRPTMMNSEGMASQELIRRSRAALLAKAYDDNAILETLLESTSNELRSLGDALTSVAGDWAKMRDMAQKRMINPDVDLTPDLLEAVRLIQRARADGMSPLVLVEKLTSTKDMFGGNDVSPRVESLVRAAVNDKGNLRSKTSLTDLLDNYIKEAGKTKAEPDMLGEQTGAGDILKRLKISTDELEARQADFLKDTQTDIPQDRVELDLAVRPNDALRSMERDVQAIDTSSIETAFNADFERLLKEQPDLKIQTEEGELTIREIADSIKENENILSAIRTCAIGKP